MENPQPLDLDTLTGNNPAECAFFNTLRLTSNVIYDWQVEEFYIEDNQISFTRFLEAAGLSKDMEPITFLDLLEQNGITVDVPDK